MNNKGKRKIDADVPEDGIADEDKVQALKAKRVKGKERVTFSEKNQTMRFNVDEELAEGQDELVEGDRITKVLGEEEESQWSDDENEKGKVEVEPFNLKSENEEGYFDRNGNYVENKIEKGVEDEWLDEYDEKWAKKFANNKARMAAQSMEDDTPTKHDTVALMKTVLSLLEPKESVTAALKRHSGGGIKAGGNQNKGKNNNKNNTNNKNNNNGDKPLVRDMEKFNKLTEAADALLNEKIEQDLDTESTNQASSSSSSSNPVLWEYKAHDGAIFGPYTSANMRDWRAQNYFTGDSAVLMRKVKDTNEDDMFAPEGDGFVSSDTIDFNQYP